MNYYLGVDGGQSSTVAIIGDEQGRIVGWATAGPCNHVGAAEGRAKFLRVMRECLSLATARACIEPKFKCACLGMSGGPEDKAGLLREIFEAERVIVTHDGKIALAGATSGEPGIIVIAGTGSFCVGENAKGENARAGGWGYIFGDEGGGFDIVRQALRAALREAEGWGPRTALTPAVIEAAGGSSANEALHLFYTAEWPRSRVATIAPLVNSIAESGDPVAVGILHTAAQQLATFAGSVRRQLWGEGEKLRLAWIGGVFQSEILLEHFRVLVELDGSVKTAPPDHSPAVGALLVAYRSEGISVVPEPVDGLKS